MSLLKFAEEVFAICGFLWKPKLHNEEKLVGDIFDTFIVFKYFCGESRITCKADT